MEASEIKPVKATELRIGNYLYEPSTGQDVQVSAKGIEMIASGAGVLLPFLLTEKWLLKFGFYKSKYEEDVFHCKFFGESICFDFSIKKYAVGFEAKDDDIIFGGFDQEIYIKIPQYVHQLQNLYFALSGEELVINL